MNEDRLDQLEKRLEKIVNKVGNVPDHEIDFLDDASQNTETNYGKGYWIIDSAYNIIKCGLTLTKAKEHLRNNYHPTNDLSITPDNPEED